MTTDGDPTTSPPASRGADGEGDDVAMGRGRATLYYTAQALRGMRASPLVQLATTGAVAVGVLLVGLAVLVVHNVEQLSHHWGRGVQIAVYLAPNVEPARAVALREVLEGRREVRSVRMVTPERGLKRLRQALGGGRSDLLDGLDAGLLPPALEVRLAAGLRDSELRPLLALLRSAPGVEQVDHLGAWSQRLTQLVVVLRAAALLIAVFIALVSLYIVASTIRLGVFARREEIEIQRLVGATERFVSIPFLIEGALQGALGALVALGALGLAYRVAAPAVARALGGALGAVQLGFLPQLYLVATVLAAALVGVAGSGLALGRQVDA